MIVEYNGKNIVGKSLLYFYANWSSNCNIHLDAIKRIEYENPNIVILKINTTKYHDIKVKYSINKIPTFIVLDENSNIISRINGYKDQYSLSKWVKLNY